MADEGQPIGPNLVSPNEDTVHDTVQYEVDNDQPDGNSVDNDQPDGNS